MLNDVIHSDKFRALHYTKLRCPLPLTQVLVQVSDYQAKFLRLHHQTPLLTKVSSEDVMLTNDYQRL